MAEIKKVWMVREPNKNEFDIFDPSYWEPRPVPTDEDELLGQFDYAEDGISVDTLVDIIVGTSLTGKGLWWKENTKIYDDAASAKKDAKKRLEAARKRHEKLEQRRMCASIAYKFIQK